MFRPPSYSAVKEQPKNHRGEARERARAFLFRGISDGRMLLDGSDVRLVLNSVAEFLMQEFGLPYHEAFEIAKEVIDSVRGYGPLEPLIVMDGVTDILVHRFDHITYERYGRTEIWSHVFQSEEELRLFILRLAASSRTSLNYVRPIASFLTPEGFRIAAAIPPASEYSTLALRRFLGIFSLDELVERGFLTEDLARLLARSVRERKNIIVSGGTGTGKTTFLGTLMKQIPEEETPVLIEEVREMPVENPRIRRLVARPPTVDGVGAITMADLLKLSLQMKPTRIIVSEVRDGAAFYVLQAMQVGHEGSMTTVHANSAREALEKRLPLMLAQAPEMRDIPESNRLAYILSSVDLAVHLSRDIQSGRRRVEEVVAVENGEIRSVYRAY